MPYAPPIPFQPPVTPPPVIPPTQLPDESYALPGAWQLPPEPETVDYAQQPQDYTGPTAYANPPSFNPSDYSQATGAVDYRTQYETERPPQEEFGGGFKRPAFDEPEPLVGSTVHLDEPDEVQLNFKLGPMLASGDYELIDVGDKRATLQYSPGINKLRQPEYTGPDVGDLAEHFAVSAGIGAGLGIFGGPPAMVIGAAGAVGAQAVAEIVHELLPEQTPHIARLAAENAAYFAAPGRGVYRAADRLHALVGAVGTATALSTGASALGINAGAGEFLGMMLGPVALARIQNMAPILTASKITDAEIAAGKAWVFVGKDKLEANVISVARAIYHVSQRAVPGKSTGPTTGLRFTTEQMRALDADKDKMEDVLTKVFLQQKGPGGQLVFNGITPDKFKPILHQILEGSRLEFNREVIETSAVKWQTYAGIKGQPDFHVLRLRDASEAEALNVARKNAQRGAKATAAKGKKPTPESDTVRGLSGEKTEFPPDGKSTTAPLGMSEGPLLEAPPIDVPTSQFSSSVEMGAKLTAEQARRARILKNESLKQSLREDKPFDTATFKNDPNADELFLHTESNIIRLREAWPENPSATIRAEMNKANIEFGQRRMEENFRLWQDQKRTASEKIANALVDTLSLPTSWILGFDFSYFMRQGGILAPAHPQTWARAVGNGLKSFADPKVKTQIYGEAVQFSEKYAPTMHISDPTGQGLTMREDAFLSHYLKTFLHLSVVGRPVEAIWERSADANATFITKFRMDLIKQYIKGAERAGRTLDQKEVDAYANFVNRATGWGELTGPLLSQTMAGLSLVTNSARYNVAAIQAPASMFNFSNPRVAFEAAKDLTMFVGFGLSTLALASQISGLDVTLDEDDPDFGSIGYGDTRIHWWGPYKSIARTAIKMEKNVSADRKTGKADTLDYAKDVLDPTVQWLRGKLNWSASIPIDLSLGENITGQEIGAPTPLGDFGGLVNEAERRLGPIGIMGIIEASVSDGWRGAALSGTDIFGSSAQTYTSLEDIRDRQAKEMYVMGADGKVRERMPGETQEGIPYDGLVVSKRNKVDDAGPVKKVYRPSELATASKEIRDEISLRMGELNKQLKDGQLPAGFVWQERKNLLVKEKLDRSTQLQADYVQEIANINKFSEGQTANIANILSGYYGLMFINKGTDDFPLYEQVDKEGAKDKKIAWDRTDIARKEYIANLSQTHVDGKPSDQEIMLDYIEMIEGNKTDVEIYYDGYVERRKQLGYYDYGANTTKLDATNPVVDAENWVFRGGSIDQIAPKLNSREAVDLVLRWNYPNRTIELQNMNHPIKSPAYDDTSTWEKDKILLSAYIKAPPEVKRDAQRDPQIVGQLIYWGAIGSGVDNQRSLAYLDRYMLSTGWDKWSTVKEHVYIYLTLPERDSKNHEDQYALRTKLPKTDAYIAAWEHWLYRKPIEVYSDEAKTWYYKLTGESGLQVHKIPLKE